MSRALVEVIADQEQVFTELIQAQRELESLSRAGREFGIIDGQSSDADEVLAAVHDAQHRLDALSAEALQSALTPHG